MHKQSIWEDFKNLPPEAQQQVMDFIAFLKIRYSSPQPARKKRKSRLVNDDFIGMWRDREDLADSTQWVRKIRGKQTDHAKG